MKFKEVLNEIKASDISNVIHLNFANYILKVESNSASLIQDLNNYFIEWVTDNTEANTKVIAFQRATPEFDYEFEEYRETPKKRIKEVFVDTDGYRVVKKVKTGVHFAIGENDWLAMGPLEDYSNQLINFINAIFMEHVLSGESYLFHAAGVAQNGEGIVIAAQSGKGKSTTALNLMNKGLDFVSNDRVILQKDNNWKMIGVPKHPRVNPGTLLNNPKVKHILREPERFEGLSKEEIWNWEEKYDAIIKDIYGDNKFPLEAKAKAFLIIDWEHDGDKLRIESLDLNSRLDLMPEIMKVPSLMTPRIHDKKKSLTQEDYIDFLGDLPIFILRGKTDPEKGLDLIIDKFFS